MHHGRHVKNGAVLSYGSALSSEKLTVEKAHLIPVRLAEVNLGAH